MNSDKVIKLLEYITKRYDVVLEERFMLTQLRPTDRFLFVEGNSLSETLERFCMELLKYTGEQFKKGLKEILEWQE